VTVADTRDRSVLRWPKDDDLRDWFVAEAERRDVSINHLLVAAARRYRAEQSVTV
jgi:hypothetical protein